MLQEAYWHGIFPWPGEDESAAIPWCFPKYRGMIPIDCVHIPHTVVRLMKKNLYEVRIDTAFEQVIRNCARRNDGEPSWITSRFVDVTPAIVTIPDDMVSIILFLLGRDWFVLNCYCG